MQIDFLFTKKRKRGGGTGLFIRRRFLLLKTPTSTKIIVHPFPLELPPLCYFCFHEGKKGRKKVCDKITTKIPVSRGFSSPLSKRKHK